MSIEVVAESGPPPVYRYGRSAYVDGRDVVPRSYVVDGFRQSSTYVASFRFGEIDDSYTTRRGTPQHNGVIGPTVFREKSSRLPMRRPPVAVYDDAEDSFPESLMCDAGARARPTFLRLLARMEAVASTATVRDWAVRALAPIALGLIRVHRAT